MRQGRAWPVACLLCPMYPHKHSLFLYKALPLQLLPPGRLAFGLSTTTTTADATPWNDYYLRTLPFAVCKHTSTLPVQGWNSYSMTWSWQDRPYYGCGFPVHRLV